MVADNKVQRRSDVHCGRAVEPVYLDVRIQQCLLEVAVAAAVAEVYKD